MARKTIRTRSPLTFLTAYAEQADEVGGENSLVIPEDLTALSDEELGTLHTDANEAFAALYNGGQVSPDDLETLAALTDGIEALQTETERREAAAAERSEQAAALAARIQFSTEEPVDPDAGEDDEAEDDDEADEDDEDGDAVAEVDEEESVTASARREVRVNLSGLRSHQAATPRPAPSEPTIRDYVQAAPDVPGFATGQGLDLMDMGRAVNSRLTAFNVSAYEKAAREGRHIRQQFGVATVTKPFSDDLRVQSNDPVHVEEVMGRATDESRLPGGSLVAAGGWCAPSETIYDLFCEDESRDGLFSLPEIGVSRGGIRWPVAPDFSSLFEQITGFHYTEEEDIAGDYDGEGGGSKPCYRIDCPDFQEKRLEVDGLCITGGLLQRRGYPEYIARIIRGALVAHDHRLAGRRLNEVASGSTAVAMPTGQVGAIAPLLTAIELQAEHYKSSQRMSRNTTLEAVFPFWVRGAVRADLSRRLGVDLISVSNARVDAWFRDAGINPQFVYNYQDLTGDAASVTSYPDEVKFLLYKAGTWVSASTDIITLDTVYDSTLLGQNDYVALFTEEGYLVANRGCDSREVTVPICPDGATSAGVAIECDGSEADAAGI